MRISAREYGRLPDHLKRLFQHIDGSDEVLAAFPESDGAMHRRGATIHRQASPKTQDNIYGAFTDNRVFSYADAGSAARFFFSAKAGTQDRWHSRHPTIKPVALIEWLVKLVTPPGGLVLDPFAGSGTTGEAALRCGRNAVLIEREDAYVADIRERIAACNGQSSIPTPQRTRRSKDDGYGLLSGLEEE